jgi:Coenzyme PQQ synthesis protein D (PqqD)
MTSKPFVLWQKNPALAWREIDEATVIISPTDSVMHDLNDTGSFLWKNIDGHRSDAELAGLLAESYEVTPDVALTDTRALLEEMSSRKLVVPVPATGGDLR